MVKQQGRKCIHLTGNEAYLGRVYSDNSTTMYLHLFTNPMNNTFQIEFLQGCDNCYKFLPQCTELLDILKQGIVGVSINEIGQMLIRQGYKVV